MSKQREIWYSPLETDENGEVTTISSEVKREGYLEYWGPTTEIRWVNADSGNIPIPINMTVAIVQDKETGKVHYSKPEEITFKKQHDK